jgi:flagellar hook-associated protein 1
MSSSPLMSLGIKAMQANYASLQVTGHNIANANVAGYSRQQAELATAQGQFTGAGFFGRGVNVVSVTRSHDAFLTREADYAKSLAATDSAKLAMLRRLETVFRGGEMGLGHATNQFLGAMTDLASRPDDLAVRRVVMARAGDLAARFTEAGQSLDDVQAGVTATLRTSVAEVNSLAQAIAGANQRIAQLKGLGQPANDLLDERERLISRLSEHVSVSRVEAADGTQATFIAGGQRLVLGAEAAQLQMLQDAADPSRSAVGLVEGGIRRPLDENSLAGGGIAGLLRFQNNDLVNARNLVGQMAAAVAGAVNEQQLRGLNLQPPLGQVASQPLFSIGAPQALPYVANARDVSGNPIGSVQLTVTDAGALKASDYELRGDPANAGQWILLRKSDGLLRAVADGDEVDGFRIDFGTPPPQAGDRFLLQPVGRAANDMRRLLDDPRDLAAASPLVATAATANSGTVQVSALAITTSPLPVAGASARISFTNDSGDYTWDLVDGANNVLASGSGSWQPGQPIPAPPQDINGFSLQLSGVPRNGDELLVEPTPASAMASNNGNAVALLALRDSPIVDGRSASESWGLAMADIGVRVQSSRSASEISAAVATQTEFSRSSKAGVNLDEEAARLIHFQQSYQAAAKMLQVAQSLFDTLLQAAAW